MRRPAVARLHHRDDDQAGHNSGVELLTDQADSQAQATAVIT